ncbi:MAG: AAA family ATPase [Steroidobacteraceae bacterium]
MYLEFFRLKELPFRLSPDPQFLYLSKNHARAKAYMESTIWFTDGFVIITGDIGSGKTTLIETFLKELSADIVVAQINQTQVSASEFLQSVLVQFGFKPFKMKKAELLATLNDFLVEQYASGRKVLLVIDEAQNLSPKVLEEVRLLSGVETTKDKVLRIVLVGQPELNGKLDAPELTQLVQRVRLRFHLTPLSAADTHDYVVHRLEVAGAEGRRIFSDDSYPTIYRYTGGVPRLINTLCDTAMMSAFAAERAEVTLADIESAIAELRWSPWVAPAPRPVTHDETQTQIGDGPQQGGETQVFMPRRAGPGAVLARLQLSTEGAFVSELSLGVGRKIVGRTADNDLQIDSRFISRHHCQIITTETACVIEDLNSTNGIFVKEKRVRRCNLNDGDVVTIGRHELTYFDERLPREKDFSDTYPGEDEFADPDANEST